MTNKNPKTTDKKVKTTENDFRIVAEGKLKGRKDISKDEINTPHIINIL